ncbi:hypothetical protein G9A89_003207 [Geosiphon pyriformis]|nr:hypothetical protein G9A89_003207 [Geosiphon pyriformis]
MNACCGDDEEYATATQFYCHVCIIEHFGRPNQDNTPCLAYGETLLDEGMWNNIPGQEGMCDISCQYIILISNWVRKETPIEATWRRAVQQLNICPHNDDKIWRMALAKIQGASPEEIKEFHEHYQTLAPIREEQEQCLAQINTRLCDHCLIPCDFQYCNECDFIYNSPPHIIYTISEEEKPISSCALESESIFNPNFNSDKKDNKNTSSSSTQYGNKNINDSDSDSNSEIYIALPDLSKEQELKWYNDNNKSIMPECTHDTNTGFDLRYSEKNTIKLEPHSCTCIDLKVALEEEE